MNILLVTQVSEPQVTRVNLLGLCGGGGRKWPRESCSERLSTLPCRQVSSRQVSAGVVDREVVGRDLLIVWVSMHTLTPSRSSVSLWKGTLFVLVTKLLQGGISSHFSPAQACYHRRAAIGVQQLRNCVQSDFKPSTLG